MLKPTKFNLFRLFFFIIVLFVSTFSILAQPRFFYSGEGPVTLHLSTEKIVVKFDSTLTLAQIRNFMNADSSLNSAIDPIPMGKNFFILHLVTNQVADVIVNRLNETPEVVTANPVYINDDSLEHIVGDEFVVKFHTEVSRSEIDSLNNEYGVMIVDSVYDVPNLFWMKITKKSEFDVLSMANFYYENAKVVYSLPNFTSPITLFGKYEGYVGTDPYFKYQYNFHNTGYTGGKVDADIDAKETWRDFILGDTSIVITIIDYGVETHEDIPSNRLVDGWDFVGDDLSDPFNHPDPDPSPGDSCSRCAHGMACAGLICATRNDIGISGLDIYCKIMPLKKWDNYGFVPINDNSYIVDAFDYARQHGADIISCSWGWENCTHDYYPEVADAIRRAYADGCVIVFSAGNFNKKQCVHFPANMDSVLAVGATDKFDSVCSYSVRDVELDVVAPGGDYVENFGGDIYSVDIMDHEGYNDLWDIYDTDVDNVNYTGIFSGTSAACPQVAGMAGMIKAYAKKIRGGITNDTLMMVIRYSAEDSMYYAESDTNWDDIHIGYGRVNLYRAMIAISRGDANHNDVVTIADAVYIATYLYQGGFPPVPIPEMGDANCDGVVTNADIVYIINFLFKGGDPPKICFKYISDWP